MMYRTQDMDQRIHQNVVALHTFMSFFQRISSFLFAAGQFHLVTVHCHVFFYFFHFILSLARSDRNAYRFTTTNFNINIFPKTRVYREYEFDDKIKTV